MMLRLVMSPGDFKSSRIAEPMTRASEPSEMSSVNNSGNLNEFKSSIAVSLVHRITSVERSRKLNLVVRAFCPHDQLARAECPCHLGGLWGGYTPLMDTTHKPTIFDK